MTVDLGDAGIYSDDFQVPPTFPSTTAGWSKIENGTSTISNEGAGTANAWAVLEIPAPGSSLIEQWGSKGGMYLEQSCTDADFTITAAVETIPNQNGIEGGIYVCNTANTELYACGWYYDSGLNRWCAHGIDQVTYLDSSSTDTATMYIRISFVESTGLISFYYSSTGTFGSSAASTTQGSFVPAKVGLYGSNFGSGGTGFDLKFDYFFESAAEISSEDATGGRRVMVVS